ncbi:MAG: hypothetical protein ABI746_11830, partial [Dermatophilaceae bacterium]
DAVVPDAVVPDAVMPAEEATAPDGGDDVLDDARSGEAEEAGARSEAQRTAEDSPGKPAAGAPRRPGEPRHDRSERPVTL